LVAKPGEGFGFSFVGGVNGDPGNPYDDTDEGIFISQIISGGAAEKDGRLSEGMRILQVTL
jgi:protein scribble